MSVASEPARPSAANGLYGVAERWYEGARIAPAALDLAVQPWWGWASTFPEWGARFQPFFLALRSLGTLQLSLPVPSFDARAFLAPEHRLGLAAAGIGVLGGNGGGYVALRAPARNGIDPCFGACPASDSDSASRQQARELGNLTSFASGVGLVGMGTAAALYWTVGDMSRHPSDAPLEIYTIGGPSGAGVFMRQPF